MLLFAKPYPPNFSPLKAAANTLLERLEESSTLNVQYTRLVLLVWLTASRLVSLRTAGDHLSWLVLVAVGGYAYSVAHTVIRFNFRYLHVKAVDFTLFQQNIRLYWLHLLLNGVVLTGCYLWHFWFGVLATLFAFWRFKQFLTEPLEVEYEAGTRSYPYEYVARQFRKQAVKESERYDVAGVTLPLSEATTHQMLVGGSGSGKTNELRLMMQSALPSIGSPTCLNRALVYDPKTEFLSYLVGMGCEESNIILLNPLDARGYAWDMAADLTRPRDAGELAKILLPEKAAGTGSSEFFDKATRSILAGVTRLFIRNAPGRWTLRDVILAAQSIELVGILAARDRTLARSLQVLGQGDTAGNVLASVSAAINELETIAAYLDEHWQQGRRFTLDHWLHSSQILVLGADRESEETLKPYNKLLMTRLSQRLTSTNTQGYTFLILDEAPSLGRIGKLDEVARVGRSYNVSLTLAFQDISAMEEVYGENVANSLLAQFDKAAFLRAKDFKSAEWMSNQIGKIKIKKYRYGTNVGQSQGSIPFSGSRQTGESKSDDYETEPVARPEDFLGFPKPSAKEQRGVEGWYKLDHWVYRHTTTSAYLSKRLLPASPLVDNYIPLDPRGEREELRLWEREDLVRLGIEFLADIDQEALKRLPVGDWVLAAESLAPDLALDIEEEESLSP